MCIAAQHKDPVSVVTFGSSEAHPCCAQRPKTTACAPPRAVLNGTKKVFRDQFSQKSPQALHVLNHGWWPLAVGWWLVVVGGGWWLVIGGWWRLAVVSRWRLVAAGGWRRLVSVGGWRLVAVGG